MQALVNSSHRNSNQRPKASRRYGNYAKWRCAALCLRSFCSSNNSVSLKACLHESFREWRYFWTLVLAITFCMCSIKNMFVKILLTMKFALAINSKNFVDYLISMVIDKSENPSPTILLCNSHQNNMFWLNTPRAFY